MEEENKFWIDFWKIVGTVVVMTVFITTIGIMIHNYRWHQSWNNCVEAGGQPVEQSLVGLRDSALTCVRK